MKEKHFVIGIDGGGTKTVAAVADRSGKIVARQKSGATNFHEVGEIGLKINLKILLRPILRRYNIRHVVFGFAGLDSAADLRILKRLVRSLLPASVQFSLYNDAEIALEAVPFSGSKVLVIAGTGSAIWAKKGSSKAKAGGLGFLLSDEGGAYYLGTKVLRSAVRSFDGRGKETILTKLVIRTAGAKNIPDAATKIYGKFQTEPENFKTYIASFAPLAGEAFQKKDVVAKEILKEAADELFLGVLAVTQKLAIADEKFCVGYVGSAFKAPLVKDILSAKIKKVAPKAYFAGYVEPVAGAVKLALEKARNE